MAEPLPNADALATLGWSAEWDRKRMLAKTSGTPARVVRHDGVKVLVSDGDSLVHATFARSMAIAVGDWILVENDTVSKVLERASQLERDNPDAGPQVIAANIDVVLVVFGADRPLRKRKVMRFVAFAWDIGAEPVIVLAKTDLVDDVSELVSDLTDWTDGVPVVETSIETGAGFDRVFEILSGRTGTLIGESGAGKSSLVNALMDDEVAWVGAVRESDAKGRHTTTHRELHLLPGGGMIIDNPGIRALGLSGDGDGVEHLFSDIESLAVQCRFRDCAHRTEPGCAQVAAVKSGGIEEDRWRAYCDFIDEQGQSQSRSDAKGYLASSRKEANAVRKAREARDEQILP